MQFGYLLVPTYFKKLISGSLIRVPDKQLIFEVYRIRWVRKTMNTRIPLSYLRPAKESYIVRKGLANVFIYWFWVTQKPNKYLSKHTIFWLPTYYACITLWVCHRWTSGGARVAKPLRAEISLPWKNLISPPVSRKKWKKLAFFFNDLWKHF